MDMGAFMAAREAILNGKATSDSSLLLSSLELSDAKVYEPQTRARLGTASHFCKVAALERARQTLPDL